MNKSTLLKKFAVTGLAAAMLVGGATSAFADGKGHGNGKGKGNGNKKGKEKTEMTIKIEFKDMEQYEWALRHIINLAPRHVFEGYEDGSFRPHQPVKRVEALVAAVRLLGLEEEAKSEAEMSASLNFKDSKKLTKDYPWAVGYVSVALKNDLFSEFEDMIQPEKGADRLWATTLLVKALKLDEEAKKKMNTKLPFKDANQIPAGAVGYVAVAIEKGLVKGYDNNTFRPNQPVTRAEMAALLDRTGDKLPDYKENSVQGTVAASVQNNVLTMIVNNEFRAYTLHPNVFVFRNNVKVEPSALQKDDQIVARVYDNQLIFIDVLKAANKDKENSFTVQGTLNHITMNDKGQLSTIVITQTVNGNTQVNIYNISADVTVEGNASLLLVPNQKVEISGKNNTVTKIKLITS